MGYHIEEMKPCFVEVLLWGIGLSCQERAHFSLQGLCQKDRGVVGNVVKEEGLAELCMLTSPYCHHI